MGLDNDMPEGWVETTLGDICENISRRFNFKQKESVVFVNTGDVLSGKFLHHNTISKEGLPGQAKKAIEYGDILYSEIRPANKRYALVDFDAKDYVVSTKFMVLKRNNKIDLNYFYLFLKSSKTIKAFQSHAEARSGTFPQITFDTISGDEINLPPLHEQKAIAKVLTAFDDKIELLQAQNKTLETMAQTIFKEWFGKYQIEDELPEGWRVDTIDNLIDLIIDYRGKTPKKLGMDWSKIGIPALSAKTIKNGKIVRRDAMNLGSNELYSIWMKDKLQKGDILLTSEAPLGEMYYLPDDTKYILSQRLFALRVKENITPEYLYHYLFSKYGQHLLNARASGSTVEGIRQSELRKIEVIIPDKNILQKSSELFKSTFEKIAINSSQVQSLTKTRDTLLPKLMSGQVRVNNIKEDDIEITPGTLVEKAEGSIPDNIIDDGPKINLF